MMSVYNSSDPGTAVKRCRWCGSEACDGVAKDGSGFWCADCDGFTYFCEEMNEKHRMLLILETGTGESTHLRKLPGLRKRISPLRYPGGKSKLAEYLIINSQPWQMSTFIEVFAGGASVGLGLLNGGRIKQLILNDADPDVYAFWKAVLGDPSYLIEKTMSTIPTRERFFEAKEKLKENITDRERAWYFFLINRTAFSGIQMANPMGDITSRWNPEGLSERIRRVSSMRERITLYNMDACAFMEQYAYWSEATTLFIDPPYYGKGKLLYPKAFTEVDHVRLADMINSLYTGFGGPDIIITYDQCPEVEDLYPWAELQRVSRTYSCRR